MVPKSDLPDIDWFDMSADVQADVCSPTSMYTLFDGADEDIMSKTTRLATVTISDEI